MTVNLEAFARPCGSQIERPAPFPTQIQSGINLAVHSSNDVSVQQFSFQKVTIYTDRKRDLTGGKIAIANQCWTGVISAIQSL
jgi:hypothetical protein